MGNGKAKVKVTTMAARILTARRVGRARDMMMGKVDIRGKAVMTKDIIRKVEKGKRATIMTITTTGTAVAIGDTEKTGAAVSRRASPPGPHLTQNPHLLRHLRG